MCHIEDRSGSKLRLSKSQGNVETQISMQIELTTTTGSTHILKVEGLKLEFFPTGSQIDSILSATHKHGLTDTWNFLMNILTAKLVAVTSNFVSHLQCSYSQPN